MRRGMHAAGTRAASAALTPAEDYDFDRYLLVDDIDDVTTDIRTILRECLPRGWEA